MSKILILGDLHIGVRNSNPVFRDMMEKYFDYLVDYVERNGIRYIFQLGDMLDNRKKIDFLSSGLLLSFLGKISKTDVEFHTILGNHDVFYKDSNNVSGISQYISAIHSVSGSNNIVLHDDSTIGAGLFIDSYEFYFFPWINSENVKKACAVGSRDNPVSKNNAVALGHFEFGGFEVLRGITMAEKPDDVITPRFFKDWHKVYSGHYHIGSKKGNVTYTGTPYMLTWADYDSPPKGFYIFDTDTGEDVFEPTPGTFKLFYKKSVDELNYENDYEFYTNKYLKVEVPEIYDDKDRLLDKVITKLEGVNVANYQVDDARENVLTVDTEISYNSSSSGDTSNIITSIMNIVGDIYKDKSEPYKTAIMNLYKEIKDDTVS